MIVAVANFQEAGAVLQRFLIGHAGDLPEHTREHLITLASHPSPVDRIVGAAEALYAVKADLSKEGREVTAQLAQFAAVHGFHGMGQRGQKIAAAMNRIGGYVAPTGMEWPSAADDPEPLAQYVPEAAQQAG